MSHEEVRSDYCLFIDAALDDELVKVLSSECNADITGEEDADGQHNWIYIHWIYLEQAASLIYKFNIYDPMLEFVIFASDLPQRFMPY